MARFCDLDRILLLMTYRKPSSRPQEWLS